MIPIPSTDTDATPTAEDRPSALDYLRTLRAFLRELQIMITVPKPMTMASLGVMHVHRDGIVELTRRLGLGLAENIRFLETALEVWQQLGCDTAHPDRHPLDDKPGWLRCGCDGWYTEIR